MMAPEASKVLADSVTALPVTRSMIRWTLATMATTASEPMSVIETGRNHLMRRARCVGLAAINTTRSAISSTGTSQRAPTRTPFGCTSRSTTVRTMKTETVNAIGQRGSMWIGSPSGSRAGFPRRPRLDGTHRRPPAAVTAPGKGRQQVVAFASVHATLRIPASEEHACKQNGSGAACHAPGSASFVVPRWFSARRRMPSGTSRRTAPPRSAMVPSGSPATTSDQTSERPARRQI